MARGYALHQLRCCTDALPTADIDPRNGGDKAWLELVRKNYDVHTWRVQTGGGGVHIIFGSTSEPIPSGQLARGIEIRQHDPRGGH